MEICPWNFFISRECIVHSGSINDTQDGNEWTDGHKGATREDIRGKWTQLWRNVLRRTVIIANRLYCTDLVRKPCLRNTPRLPTFALISDALACQKMLCGKVFTLGSGLRMISEFNARYPPSTNAWEISKSI